jgi:hypothetical protein
VQGLVSSNAVKNTALFLMMLLMMKFNVYWFYVHVERTSEELPSEITLVASPALVKPEPISATPEGESGRCEGSLRNSTQEPSTVSEPREGSQDSVEDDQLTLVSNCCLFCVSL